MSSLRVRGDTRTCFFSLRAEDIPSIHLPGTKTHIHSYLAWDPVPTWEVGKFLSSLSLCCLEEGAGCSPEPIARFRGTAQSRMDQTSSCLPSMWTIAQWSSHLQRAGWEEAPRSWMAMLSFRPLRC